jgi:hypothetical protein
MRKKILSLALLVVFVPMISGCIAAAVYAVKAKQASDQQKQVAEVESKVAGTDTDTYKQAEVKTIVQKPLAEVYQAVMLTTGSDMPATAPSGVSRDRSQVNFTDTEPIYQNGKPIFGGGGTGRGIMVTVYLESQGPRATAVYYYPHNKLYETIPPEQQKVVEANMQYRGRQFLYRLETQANCKQKWAWLRN